MTESLPENPSVEAGAKALLAVLARHPRETITIVAHDPSWDRQPEASKRLLRDVAREILDAAAKEAKP